jgi:hypothetical protein
MEDKINITTMISVYHYNQINSTSLSWLSLNEARMKEFTLPSHIY